MAVEIERAPTTILIEGAAIERKLHKDIAELLSANTRVMTIGGYRVATIAAAGTMPTMAMAGMQMKLGRNSIPPASKRTHSCQH